MRPFHEFFYFDFSSLTDRVAFPAKATAAALTGPAQTPLAWGVLAAKTAILVNTTLFRIRGFYFKWSN